MLKLIDNFYLDADDRQYILIEWDGTYDKKTGKSKQGASYWYIQKLEKVFDQMLTVMIRRKVSRNEINGIKELKNTVWEEEKKMQALFDELQPTIIKQMGV